MLIDFPVQFPLWVWRLMGVITAEKSALGWELSACLSFFVSVNLLFLLIKKRRSMHGNTLHVYIKMIL